MSKSFRYVDEFDFAPAGKTVGEPVRGRMLKDKSSLGIKGNKNPGIKNPAKPVAPEQPMKAAFAQGGKVGGCYAEGGMMGKKAAPRVAARKPGGAFNSKPMVAPLTAMKSGGPVPKAGAYKVPKVMGEFKAGELHSGSKTGPVVKSPKQAMAIAMSEARAAGKKK